MGEPYVVRRSRTDAVRAGRPRAVRPASRWLAVWAGIHAQVVLEVLESVDDLLAGRWIRRPQERAVFTRGVATEVVDRAWDERAALLPGASPVGRPCRVERIERGPGRRIDTVRRLGPPRVATPRVVLSHEHVQVVPAAPPAQRACGRVIDDERADRGTISDGELAPGGSAPPSPVRARASRPRRIRPTAARPAGVWPAWTRRGRRVPPRGAGPGVGPPSSRGRSRALAVRAPGPRARSHARSPPGRVPTTAIELRGSAAAT